MDDAAPLAARALNNSRTPIERDLSRVFRTGAARLTASVLPVSQPCGSIPAHSLCERTAEPTTLAVGPPSAGGFYSLSCETYSGTS